MVIPTAAALTGRNAVAVAGGQGRNVQDTQSDRIDSLGRADRLAVPGCIPMDMVMGYSGVGESLAYQYIIIGKNGLTII